MATPKYFCRMLIALFIAVLLSSGYAFFYYYKYGMIADSAKAEDAHFFEIKDIVINIKNNNNNNKQYYLVLELGVAFKYTKNITGDARLIKKTIRGATVNLFHNMEYKKIAEMNSQEMQQSLLKEYKKVFSELKIPIILNDVMINKFFINH